MWKTNLSLAFRTLKNNPGYTFINLSGLLFGITACLLIVLYIAHEQSYDRFHANHDRIQRVNYDIEMGGKQTLSPSVPVFVAPQLKNLFPEVEEATRFSNEWRPRTIRYKDKMFDEPGFAYADPNFFKVFDFKCVQGDLSTALARPNTLVITASMAEKYFGNSDPIGQQLTFNNKKQYEVAAVMADVPANSHFSFHFLTSHYSQDGFGAEEAQIAWNNPNYSTYLLLKPNTDVGALAQKIDGWVNPPDQAASANTLHLPLEPLTEAHFNTRAFNFANYLAITDPKFLSIFGSIALLILLIAAVNYVNLSTARASMRAKEVGVRKTAGARFGQLVEQFLAESFLLTLPAFALSVCATWLLLPALNNLLDKKIPFRLFEGPMLAGVVGGWLLLSFLAGVYPALVLSKFKPLAVLKGNFSQPGSAGPVLRKSLVLLQFSISTMLIVGTLVVHKQLDFMQSKKLGFEQESVLIIRGNADLYDKLGAFCTKLSGLSGVESVCQAGRSPFETVIGNGFSLNPNPTESSDWHMVGGIAADGNYLQTLDIQLIAGRNFDPTKIKGDSTMNEFIVNEAFLRHYNLTPEEAVGRQSMLGNTSQRGPGTIVGVMQDFHTASLREKVEPIVLFNHPDFFASALVRLRHGDVPAAMAQLEAAWKSEVPMRPFNFSFLDEQYDALYRSEQRMNTLMTFFAGLGILVACMGLFGLAAFATMRRTKEIGIRKVLGASVAGITGLLAKDFLKLVVIAIVVASPIAYYFMQKWLADFAYRIDIQWWMFAVAGLAALAIAFLTVSFQSVRAALANPVKSLRSE